MARHTIVRMIDDMDGSEGAELVRFGLDGKQYEIDLSSANRARLVDALAPFLEHARKAAGVRGVTHLPAIAATPGRRDVYDREKAVAVRSWAKAEGLDVASVGRVPAKVVAAYEKQHQHDPMAAAEAKVGHERDECEDLDNCEVHRPTVPGVEFSGVKPATATPEGQAKATADADALLGKKKRNQGGTVTALSARAKKGMTPNKPAPYVPTDADVMAWVRANAGNRVVKRTSPTTADRNRYAEAHTVTTSRHA